MALPTLSASKNLIGTLSFFALLSMRLRSLGNVLVKISKIENFFLNRDKNSSQII
jgi:hypothetical protein